MKRSVAIVGMALVCALGFFGLNKLNQPKAFDPDAISDVVEHLTGLPGDTVLATVDDRSITAGEYFYWVGYSMETMESYYGQIDWAGSTDGETMSAHVKQSALDTCVLYDLVAAKAEAMGRGATEEDLAEYQLGRKAMAEQLGGEEEMKKWLLQVGLSEENFKQINLVPILYQNILDSLMDVSPATEEEMADYIAENDVLKAKHILLMTVDPVTREPLSDDEIAAKKEQAEDILKQLRESEQPLALFDELMYEYSEDTGLATNPDGYHFTANQMVPEFEQGTRDLEYNEISELVESTYGYHIILRLDPADEAFAADVGQLLGEAEAVEEMDALVSDWMAEAETETTEAYETVDIAAYYDNLKALRAEIEAQDAAA